MALIVNYRKIAESPASLEYLYGYPEPDRRLVIDIEGGTARSPDGEADRLFDKAVVGIFGRHRREGTWPAAGTVAS